MDFSLPGMDGLCATKDLKADPATRHLTVVGLTAHAMKGDEQIARTGVAMASDQAIDTRTFVATVKNFIASANLPPTQIIPWRKKLCKVKKQNLNPPPSSRTGLGFVLVVDDEEQNRTLLRDPLEACGYEVTEGRNGLQALQKIAEHPPDVILLDVMMPKMDGFGVCRRLKNRFEDGTHSHLDGDRVIGPQERLMGAFCGWRRTIF